MVDDTVRARLHAVRRRVRLIDGRPNDGRCGNVAAAVEQEFGWRRECGYLRLLDGSVSWVHCWNRLPDGSVVDATSDQFGALWLGDLAVVEASVACDHYRPDPPEWDLTRLGPADHPTAVVAVRGGDSRTMPLGDSAGGWRSAARVALQLVTEWQLPEDDVELAARALRAELRATGSASTAELIRPLVTAGIQRSAQREDHPWIAGEFADPL